MGNLSRVQMLLEPKQHEALKRIAKERGTSVAEVTREAISQWLEGQQRETARTQQLAALERARGLREAMRTRYGKPLEIDVVGDLNAMREERLDQLTTGRD
jgi:hypothetical protein